MPYSPYDVNLRALRGAKRTNGLLSSFSFSGVMPYSPYDANLRALRGAKRTNGLFEQFQFQRRDALLAVRREPARAARRQRRAPQGHAAQAPGRRAHLAGARAHLCGARAGGAHAERVARGAQVREPAAHVLVVMLHADCDDALSLAYRTHLQRLMREAPEAYRELRFEFWQ